MRKDEIHSIEYILPVVKDDYGNDLWLALVNAKYKKGQTMHPSSGYLVISKTSGRSDFFNTYAKEEEAFWKTKDRNLLKIDTEDFHIEEYQERVHRLEKDPNIVTRFYVMKKIK